MKNLIVTCKDKLAAVKTTLATMLFFAFSSAHAALPDTADPTNAAADGDYIGLLKGYAFDIAMFSAWYSAPSLSWRSPRTW